MTSSTNKEAEEQKQPSARRWPLVLGVLVLGVIVFVVIWLFWLGSEIGDDFSKVLKIVNRSDETLVVFTTNVGFGSSVRVATVPAHSAVSTDSTCPIDLVARTIAGVEVARRPGSPDSEHCDVDDWVIGPTLEGA
jgi:hypothetical protein